MTVTTGTERASGVSLSAAMERVAMPRDERGNVRREFSAVRRIESRVQFGCPVISTTRAGI